MGGVDGRADGEDARQASEAFQGDGNSTGGSLVLVSCVVGTWEVRRGLYSQGGRRR